VYIDVVLDPTDCPLPAIVEAAQVAEEVGFDGVFTYDHLSGVTLGGSTVRHVWPTLTALVTATRSVAVGPLVINATRHHPVEIAVAIASLQELSGGRIIVGLGAGAGPGSPFARELTMAGMTPLRAATRRRVIEESIAMIRAVWQGTSLRGAHFGISDPTGFLVPDPIPPLIVGANGPKMAALAGRVADGVNLHASEFDLGVLSELVGLARSAPGAEPDRFLVTVEAEMNPVWMDPDSGPRRELTAIGVARLMLRWRRNDGLAALAAAGSALASARSSG
jgi:alkanesulfonate monooxygenase SsuD/methylene tetrahydromethanopterin reductase-like flavin-dependent oxidoreductase (luciferase family)